MTYRDYLDPHVLSKLKGLELKARTIVEGYVSGLHASPYHGYSVEFAEHREYVAGDDLRYVDWKVYGKSDRFFLKQFEEETNFNCHLLLDTSESMAYQSQHAPFSKLEYAQLLAASLGYVVIRQQDSVGLVTFDKAVTNLIRPAGQPAQLRQICHVMEQTPAEHESAIGPILHELAQRIRRRGLVILLSDLFDDVESVLMGLKHFKHQRHDVTVVQVIDPAEQDFPFQDPTLFRGLEGMPDQMTEPKSLRKAYQREFETFLKELRRGCRNLRMDHVLLRTDEPLDAALTSLLTRRVRTR